MVISSPRVGKLASNVDGYAPTWEMFGIRLSDGWLLSGTVVAPLAANVLCHLRAPDS